MTWAESNTGNSTCKKLAVQWLNEALYASYQVQWQTVFVSEIANFL